MTGPTPTEKQIEALADLEEVRKAVFGDVGDEPDVYADYDRCSELSGKMRKAISALTAALAVEAGTEPRAWFVKDYADGWIHFDNEADALREVEAMGPGTMMMVGFPPSALTTSPASSGVEGEAVAPIGYVTSNDLTKLLLGASCVDLFGAVVPGGVDMVPVYFGLPAPTPAGDGLQAAVNKWAAAATAYNDHNSRDLRHALDAAEEVLMSLASPAPPTEDRDRG